MKTPHATCDATSLEFEEMHSSSVATLDPCNACEVAMDSASSGPRCEKCDAPLKSDVVTVCRHCGWYASLGTYVEVDKDYEAFGDHKEADSAPQPPPSHLQVWLNLLPRWAWTMFGSVGIVVAASIVVRLATPGDSSIRMYWSLAQLTAGLLTFAGCHIINMLVVAGHDPDVGVADLLLKPLKLWMRTLTILPTRLWVANGALNGLTAGLMSLVVIGGIPYERFWDWGFKEPPKQNLMGALMAQAAKADGGGAKDLEGAVGSFAGQAGIDSNGKKSAPEQKPAEKPRQKTDCVILGYHADKSGNVLSLVLGTALEGKLVYACSVTPQLEGEDRAAFAKALTAARTDRPFLSMDSDAIWVRPKFSCRVSYTEQDEVGRLSGAEWVKLLGTTGL
jgi:ATP dependent DNA ligase C terminal region